MDDLIERQAVIDALGTITMYKGSIPHDTAVMKIEQLPSVQPEIVRCKDCKYFERDHFVKIEKFPIPLIVAHEVCTKWGKGCRSRVDGWCFMAERRTDE